MQTPVKQAQASAHICSQSAALASAISQLSAVSALSATGSGDCYTNVTTTCKLKLEGADS